MSDSLVVNSIPTRVTLNPHSCYTKSHSIPTPSSLPLHIDATPIFTRPSLDLHSCSLVFHSCSLVFHSCSLVFHSCFIRVSLVFHSCFTRVSLVFHSCFTRVSLVGVPLDWSHYPADVLSQLYWMLYVRCFF